MAQLRQHSSRHHVHGDMHHHRQHHHDEAGLADLLDLDAELLAPLLDELGDWAAQHAPETVHTVVDVGAGTGTASLALAGRFAAAEVFAVDRSAVMLQRMGEAATERGLVDRLRAVQCDLDAGWPPVRSVNLAWASSSLHEVADPDRVLGDIHAALNPGGVLVVV